MWKVSYLSQKVHTKSLFWSYTALLIMIISAVQNLNFFPTWLMHACMPQVP